MFGSSMEAIDKQRVDTSETILFSDHFKPNIPGLLKTEDTSRKF